ncbi:hypothetical protein GGG17_12625 [Arsenicicoccus sp. MKL-02]|uniref:Uncharacterized protein n=1 Tax=Arsenicicoccus cauae TaxID=2663847 RepID=A0A6I3IWS2_9MICO|nr:hypothetical protein [Arsenicicoccus cauae]MTB72791.1 hypothetical protein [Arsenicicoccus cauae]
MSYGTHAQAVLADVRESGLTDDRRIELAKAWAQVSIALSLEQINSRQEDESLRSQ